ncbi:MAG: MBL fold metallo-hydrolase, partial [Verrucomicrobiales bacterium]
MITRKKTIALGSALSAAVVAVLATCAKSPRMPALDGAIIEIRRSDQALHPGDSGYSDTLQLFWFGTACHLIQLGGTSVLTDPFVTNELDVFRMASNPERIDATLARIKPPDCVLINHSHHDHILDAHAAMAQDQWLSLGVPLYGSQSAVNLLAGFDGGQIDPRWRTIAPGQAVSIATRAPGHSTNVTAFRTEHGAHLKCGFTLANGLIEEPRRSPPRRLTDFQSCEVFNFLIELQSPGGSKFSVFYLGAPFDLDKRPDSLPP